MDFGDGVTMHAPPAPHEACYTISTRRSQSQAALHCSLAVTALDLMSSTWSAHLAILQIRTRGASSLNSIASHSSNRCTCTLLQEEKENQEVEPAEEAAPEPKSAPVEPAAAVETEPAAKQEPTPEPQAPKQPEAAPAPEPDTAAAEEPPMAAPAQPEAANEAPKDAAGLAEIVPASEAVPSQPPPQPRPVADVAPAEPEATAAAEPAVSAKSKRKAFLVCSDNPSKCPRIACTTCLYAEHKC